MPHTKCLILSAHADLIDRRIIAQANFLASRGREMTLVSVPAEGQHSLAAGIRTVMAARTSKKSPLRRLARRLPAPLKNTLRGLAWRRGQTPVRPFTEYFLAHTPVEMFDVIHCHDLQTLPAALLLRDRIAPGAKVIYDSHELFPYQYPPGKLRDYWAKLEGEHIPHCDAVITVNESIADQMAARYPIARPVVLYNSCHLTSCEVSAEEFCRHFKADVRHFDGAFRIVFQGGLVREKNVEALVGAVAMLGDRFRLFLLGGGVLEKRLRALAHRQKASNVHFGKWIPAEKLLGFVAHAHAGIIPYLDDGLPNNHYCTPNKLFEYLEAGVPVCANDLPELRKIVRGEKIGAVYSMRTAREIAAAIEDFAGLCRAGDFSAEAFAKSRDKYSWSRQADRLLQLYEQLGV